jgi:hypothetical protein
MRLSAERTLEAMCTKGSLRSAPGFVDSAKTIYEKFFRADNRLAAVYPDAGHEFSAEIRDQAYRFLGRRLR